MIIITGLVIILFGLIVVASFKNRQRKNSDLTIESKIERYPNDSN